MAYMHKMSKTYNNNNNNNNTVHPRLSGHVGQPFSKILAG